MNRRNFLTSALAATTIAAAPAVTLAAEQTEPSDEQKFTDALARAAAAAAEATAIYNKMAAERGDFPDEWVVIPRSQIERSANSDRLLGRNEAYLMTWDQFRENALS